MTDRQQAISAALEYHNARPTFSTTEEGVVLIKTDEPDTLMNLFNVQTLEAASGLAVARQQGQHIRTTGTGCAALPQRTCDDW